MIFAICLVDENSNKASARKFIEEIERTGIRDGWARVKMMANYSALGLVSFNFQKEHHCSGFSKNGMCSSAAPKSRFEPSLRIDIRLHVTDT